MRVDCTCGERMYFTGEVHPATTPQRFYACQNKHMRIVYNDPIPDWGNYEISRQWREALTKRKTDEYGDMP